MKYLRYWRLVRGLTQFQVATKCKISQGHYCEIERRGKLPRPEMYDLLAQAINRPVEEVVAKLHGVDQRDMASAK